ncbi:serine hydrolase [Nocardiopsis sp. CNR-923]|uniref:serine hydrolase n=1 Tax=Nocardiopsis sp. CNR-923 TaxID=1904965 RepID=UPI0009696A99|nr:serine hydrolase [Nocardiopsis sp. CNR-923]OLT26404.1 serine hydrolase [Nocardiopsis sp. CNR-923]
MTTTDTRTLRVHAREIDGTAEEAHRADEPVVLASIAKILIVLEFARQAATGRLDPAERVVARQEHRLGGIGTSDFADDVELSLRDCAALAMTVSDNTAADLIVDRVGVEPVQLLAAELGLTGTRFTGGPRSLLHTLMEEDADSLRTPRDYDPARATSATPRDLTLLLSLIWTDRAAPPDACAFVRALMARQLDRSRIASGFPPAVHVSAKSGTLPGLRQEAGVVEYPDGRRYAVAVSATVTDPGLPPMEIDLTLGRAARRAVDHMRGQPL